ncbi:MAG: signal peptide peptidase SppA, partial [Acidobacteriota bacterium]
MRRIIVWILAVVIVGVVVMAVAVGIGYALISGTPIQIEKGTVVEFRLIGPLNELPQQNILTQFLGLETSSLWEMGKTLQYAARDDRVSGVYLEIHPLLLSWAQIEEFRDYMMEFRQSGKPLHVFLALDMVRDPELYLAAAADSITLNPDAGLLVNGLVAEVTFYKTTMEKLGIKPEFIQFKEYKSAESYTRENMTPEIREMYESILEDIESRLVTVLSRDRNVSEESVREFLQSGVASGTKAVEEHLIDGLGYENEVLDLFEEGESGKYQGVTASHYLAVAEEEFHTRSEHKVALVGGLGTITSGDSDPFSETMGGMSMASHLRQVRNNNDLKGVILRVDSPGGSAVGSDMIWKEVSLLEEAGKPVVVTMSGVAGSGGYYISMAAREIISQPSTITGSIGVIFGKFDLAGLYQWLGISIDKVKTSPNADIFSINSSLSDAQRRSVESWIEDTYETFVGKAAEGRQMAFEELEPMARGRIYTGAQARELGLVDELGGLQTAIEHMEEILGIKENEEIELVLYPRPKTFWEQLASGSLLRAPRQPSINQWLEKQFPLLSRPGPWVLMPEA